jgi:hypothetical protein
MRKLDNVKALRSSSQSNFREFRRFKKRRLSRRNWKHSSFLEHLPSLHMPVATGRLSRQLHQLAPLLFVFATQMSLSATYPVIGFLNVLLFNLQDISSIAVDFCWNASDPRHRGHRLGHDTFGHDNGSIADLSNQMCKMYA